MNGGLPPYGSARPALDPAAVARSVLAQPRFRIQVEAPAHRTWWDALHDWLGDRWNDLMQLLSRNVHVGTKTGAAFGDILLVALVALVVIVAVRLLWNTVRVGTVRDMPARPGAHEDAATLHARSLAAAERGDYAHAILLLFRAALAALDIQGLLYDDPSRTVNECRREVRAKAPALAAPFDAIALPFADALYGDRTITQAQWRAACEACASFPGIADA